MRKKIWKYPIKLGPQTIDMPKGSVIRHFALQNDIPTLWVEVDSSAELVPRNFIIVGTGHTFENTSLTYIGTVVGHEGVFVWHLFQEGGEHGGD